MRITRIDVRIVVETVVNSVEFVQRVPLEGQRSFELELMITDAKSKI